MRAKVPLALLAGLLLGLALPLGIEGASFPADSDVFTNPWLGLYQVGDSYSLAGTGTFTGATRTWSIIGQETVLGVRCLVLRIHGHGTGSYANEYYDVRVAQDTDGNLRFLKVTGWEPAGGALDWTVSTPANASMLFPATAQAGQRWMMFDQQSEVIAVGQTVAQLSTGFGPTGNCAHIAAVSDDGDVDESWWGSGIGVVKEVWNDGGQLNGWERMPGAPTVGLIAYYPFDGTTDDVSGNGNTGLNHGAILTPDRFGRSERAYFFGHSERYVTLPPQMFRFNNNRSFTASAWIRCDENVNEYQTVIQIKSTAASGKPMFTLSKSRSGYMSGKLYAEIYGSPTAWSLTFSSLNGPDVVSGQWHLVTGVVDSADATLKLYVDGSLNDTAALVSFDLQDISVTIGADVNYGTPFLGAIDDVRFYSRSLTATEIQQIYALGSEPTPVSFPANSDVFTNPWLGLYQVGDSYSFAGTGSLAGASRSFSLIGRETMLGVECLVLRVLGHGTGADASEYYDARLAQDTAGNLRILKITGWTPSGPVAGWEAPVAAAARMGFPAVMQVGQRWEWLDEELEVLAVNQTLPQLSTGFGPTPNCVYIRKVADAGDDINQSWWGSGVGVVKEIWSDTGDRDRWERVPDSGFASWMVQAGLPGDRRGPADRNGPLDLPNLLAYALGVNPMTAQPSDLPTGSLHDAGAQKQFRFIYRRSKTAIGIELRVVGVLSLEAADWQPVTATPVKVGDTPDGLAELWQVTIPMDAPQQFLRLEVLPQGAPPAPAGMALIPAGAFTMGDTFNEGNSHERPAHSVYVSAFYMDEYEVTKALWDEVKDWNAGNGYSYDNHGSGRASDHPVQTINWYDIAKWCNARSQKEGLTPCYYMDASLTVVYKTGQVTPYVNWSANGCRLPTEAEWEKAARGGASGHRFPWSDADTIQHSRANYYSPPSYQYDISPTRYYHPAFATGGFPYTSPVGHFAPNGYGLYDMAGDVWEWCWDWYSDSYYGRSTLSDPPGPASGSLRVIRGGGWDANAFLCRAAHRYFYPPTNTYNYVGFRCVRARGE